MSRGALLVLMYHGLHADADDAGRFDPRYSVEPQQFERQMQRLADCVDDVVLPAADGELPPPAAARRTALITFDDGDVSNATVALPILRRLGLPALFFVTSDFVDQPGMLSRAQIAELAAAGMMIGAHGASHRFFSTLPTPALRAELEQSRAQLAAASGQPVATLALPGGRGGRREVELAHACGYRSVFGSVPGDNRRHDRERPWQRLAMTRSLSLPAFEALLRGERAPLARLQLRHSLLAMPKRVLGDQHYDRLREALVR